MSDVFREGSGEGRAPEVRRSGRTRALVATAVVLLVLFLGLTTFASLYTDRLWFADSGYGRVFSTMFWTRAALFVVFGLLMALVVGAAIVLAYRYRPFFRPSSPEQSGLDRYRDAVTPVRTWLLVGTVVLLGAFAGSSAMGQWRSFMLWRHGGSFDQKDPWFHHDIGFYVFTLPWLHYLVDFAMATLLLAALASAVVHYLYGGIRLQASRDRLSGPAQVQLSVLVGLFVLVKAADYWLDRYDVVNQGGALITGMNYTDDHAVLPAKNILLGISVICAVLFFVNVWRRTWLLPSVGLALFAVSAVLLGLIWPGIVQQFQVKPSEADKERPYIAANIKATRSAYDLNDVEVVNVGDATIRTADQSQLASQTSSVPLVDPKLVSPTFEQVQQGRSYYSVADVLDVDHYDIQGIDRALVLGVRELDQSGINATDRNWSNLHTVYTHGSGIIAAFGNQRTTANQVPVDNSDDQTQWAQGQRVGQDALATATGGFEPRVYFGEQSPTYSIVGKPKPDAPDVELDLPTGNSGTTSDEDTTTTYDGSGGVPIGSTFRRLMYAVKFNEKNFLLSGRVNANSEVLYNRDPRQRVEKFAPWLTVDSDPYPIVADGRILWVLDGYTSTDHYPGSERESFETMTKDSLQPTTALRTVPTDEINYMRNAVKATVDAYDGTVTLYAWDESDPILQAWEDAFPDTVRAKADIPDDVLKHLRYPEDLFKVQRYQYARYHVTDPTQWFSGNDRWQVPSDPNSPSDLQPPYRLFISQPAGPQSTGAGLFSLTSTFVPNNKSNLAAFVSVDSDATSENYGKITVMEVNDQGAKGPGQVANDFNSDTQVADRLAQFNRSGGQAIYGNLLTLPVDSGFIYVEPVYAVRAGSSVSYPSLAYVLVSYNGDVGIGKTLTAALGDVLGASPQPPADGGGDAGKGGKGGKGGKDGQGASVPDQIRDLLTRAQAKFDAADRAFRSGDTVTWAKLTAQGKQLVTRAVRLADQLPQGGAKEPAPSSASSASSASSGSAGS